MYFRMSAGQLEALFTDAGVLSEKTVQKTTGGRFEPEHRGGVSRTYRQVVVVVG